MNKEKFIIGIGMIVASIFFTFIGIIMLIIFFDGSGSYPKNEVMLSLASIIGWMIIWMGVFAWGVIMLIKQREPRLSFRITNNLNNENKDNSEVKS